MRSASTLRRSLRAADDRSVSSASTFSTILLHEALSRSTQPRRRRVLDVGSGPSPYRDLVPADTLVAIDRTVAPAADRLTVAGDAAALPFADHRFDGLICTEVIEHVPDERLLAAELARVATDGAVLLLSSPFVHGVHEQPHDYRRLTSIGLVTVLEGAGWRVDVVRSVGGPMVVSVDTFVRWVDPLARSIARRVGGADGRALHLVARASRALQQALAGLTLLSPASQVTAVDPYRPGPRLTLGYVVTATAATTSSRRRS